MKSWAEAHGLDVIFVRESSRLPEVTEMIAGHRKRLAGRGASRGKKLPAPAIDRLPGRCPDRSREAAGFQAELALLRRRLVGCKRSSNANRVAALENRRLG